MSGRPGRSRGRRPSLSGALLALFPSPGPSGTSKAALVCGYGAGFVGATLVAYLRQSGMSPSRTLWAEDGAVFFGQATSKDFLRDLVTSYNGYDQLVPRIGGELARAVPIADVPMVMSWGGAALLGLLCCLVFHMARGHIPSPAARLVLAASMPLLPVAVVEMLDNWVNVPWWMFFATFWALLWRPRSAVGRWVAAALCALAAASEPLVGLLAPLALLRAYLLRSRGQNAPSLGLLAGLVFQGVVVLGDLGNKPFHPSAGAQLLPDFFERVGLGWLTGLRGTDWVASGGRALVVALGASALLVVVVLGLTSLERSVRALTVAVLMLAPLCFVVPVWLRGVMDEMQPGSSVGYAGRYAATPMLMVLCVLLAAAGRLGSGRARNARAVRRSRVRWERQFGLTGAVLACAAALVPSWAVDFRDGNARSGGPAWGTGVAAATSHCRGAKAEALVGIPIDPPGLSVVVRCALVEASQRGALIGR